MKVTKLTPVNKDNTLAYIEFEIDTELGPMQTYNSTLFEKDGKRWLSLPSKTYQKEGKTKYFGLNRYNEQGMAKLSNFLFTHYDQTSARAASVTGTSSILDDDDGLPF